MCHPVLFLASLLTFKQTYQTGESESVSGPGEAAPRDGGLLTLEGELHVGGVPVVRDVCRQRLQMSK